MRFANTPAILLAVILTASARGAAPAATPAARYSVTRLDSGRGDLWTARPAAINESGDVAGVLSRWSDGTHLPFHWSPAGGTQVLPGIAAGSYRQGAASSLNDAGQVVGDMDGRPFLWSAETGTRPIAREGAIVYGINNAGTLAGYAGLAGPGGNEITGFRVHPGGREELLTLEEYPRTMVLGLNAGGDAIARAFRDDREPLARSFVWNADGTVRHLPAPPDDPRRFFPAVAINDKGWVVGDAYLSTPDGRMIDLGTLYEPDAPTDARALNNAGLVTGYVAIQDGEEGRAFAWSDESGIVSLNERLDVSGEGWVLMYAQAVNESGQIAGWGEYLGVFTGFILTPVPEPGATCIAALAGLLTLRRRRPKRCK